MTLILDLAHVNPPRLLPDNIGLSNSCSVIYALVAVLIVSCCLAIPGIAQESAQERAANLRAQLTEMQAKQAELQTRLRQLEEDIKPENKESIDGQRWDTEETPSEETKTGQADQSNGVTWDIFSIVMK